MKQTAMPLSTSEADIFFALLRHALWNEPLVPEQWGKTWSWNAIFYAVEMHALQSLLTNSILSLPKEYQPDGAVQNRFMQLMALNMREHSRLNADIVSFFTLLQQHGFHPVLMKGQSLAPYYKKPFFRKCGDVDVYVGSEDYDAVCDFLKHQYPQAVFEKATDKHQEMKWKETEYEIHCYSELLFYPQDDKAYQKLMQEAVRNLSFVKIAETEIPVFPIQILPVYLLSHLWNHFKTGGVGFRQFADLAMCLHNISDSLDREKLQKDLKDVKLWDEWLLCGALMVQRLGLPASEFPFYEKMNDQKLDNFVSVIMEDGNFASGRDYGKEKKYWRKKFRSLCIHINRYACLLKISIPLSFKLLLANLMMGFKRLSKGV